VTIFYADEAFCFEQRMLMLELQVPLPSFCTVGHIVPAAIFTGPALEVLARMMHLSRVQCFLSWMRSFFASELYSQFHFQKL
jgi:hypothetical protein